MPPLVARASNGVFDLSIRLGEEVIE